MLTDYYFWFSQPSSILSLFDLWLGYIFVAAFVLGIIFWVIAVFQKHEIIRKVLKRFRNLALTLSLTGLIWFAFRYEATPIFAKRFWVLVIFLVMLVWLIWILKYLLFSFAAERKEYQKQQINSKYLPQRKK